MPVEDASTVDNMSKAVAGQSVLLDGVSHNVGLVILAYQRGCLTTRNPSRTPCHRFNAEATGAIPEGQLAAFEDVAHQGADRLFVQTARLVADRRQPTGACSPHFRDDEWAAGKGLRGR
jgi:hypothetical protein